jgi:predicted DNA-binding protein
MAKKVTRREDQFVVRLPAGMRDRIAAVAANNGRSMNAEIVKALEKHLENDDTLTVLWEKVERLEAMIRDHDEQLRPDKYLK